MSFNGGTKHVASINVSELFFFHFCNLAREVANIGRLSTKGSVLLLCDMQEKFRPNIFQFDNIVSNAARLLQVGKYH